MSSPNKIQVIVVVSGQPITLEVNLNQKIEHLIHEALQSSGNKGQPATDWELRTTDGRLLEPGISVEDALIVNNMTLFLSPRAGVGGDT